MEKAEIVYVDETSNQETRESNYLEAPPCLGVEIKPELATTDVVNTDCQIQSDRPVPAVKVS